MADKAMATSPGRRRAFPSETVAKALYEFADDVTIETTVAGAIDRALMLANPDDIVLVTGSLYTAGEARQWLSPKVSLVLQAMEREVCGKAFPGADGLQDP